MSARALGCSFTVGDSKICSIVGVGEVTETSDGGGDSDLG
jgi:hypothetical protein